MKSKKKKNKQDSTDETVTQELKDRRNDIAMADWGIDYDELDPTQKRIVNKTIKSQSPNARSVPSYHMIKPKSVIRKNGTRKVSAPVKSHPVNHELLWQRRQGKFKLARLLEITAKFLGWVKMKYNDLMLVVN